MDSESTESKFVTNTNALKKMDVPNNFKNMEEFILCLRDVFIKQGIKVLGKDSKVEIHEPLGEGAFGIVKRATLDDKEVAIKFINKFDEKNTPDKTIKTIVNEILVLTSVNHERVPTFHGVYFDDEKHLGLIFKFIKGKTLMDYVEAHKPSDAEKVGLLLQLAEILKTMHDRNIIHRDVKPKNTMVSEEGELYLIDFGISKINEKVASFTEGVKFSPAYGPPEAINIPDEDDEEGHGGDDGHVVTVKFDVWSLGCILLELFSGHKPWYKQKDKNAIYVQLQKEKPMDMPPDFADKYPAVKDLIDRCLEYDVESRLSTDELIEGLQELKESFSE